MATKWVSLDKLRYAISKIHTLLQGKVDKVDGKGLSANDLTAALKGNYDAAYTHSQTAHAPALRRRILSSVFRSTAAISRRTVLAR